MWPWFSGGCRCDRDTRATLAAAGLDVSGLNGRRVAPVPPVAAGLMGTVRV